LERTIYRDIGELMGRGVPVWGEPGVGYALRGSFDLPPLMFDEQELESPVPGAWLLAAWCELRGIPARSGLVECRLSSC
jgi:predicted DNA-binding transcriptional regulator YafY